MSDMFAFKLAQPASSASTDEGVPEYDASRQQTVWAGGASMLSVSCTNRWWAWPAGRSSCNAYGTWCNTWGSGGSWFCD